MNLAMEEAKDWVKEKSIEIEKHITKEHHKLIELFQAYRKRTDGRLAYMDKMEARDILLTNM